MTETGKTAKIVKHCPVAEWRNWQTHQTQNLALFTQRVGSTPTSATTSEPHVKPGGGPHNPTSRRDRVNSAGVHQDSNTLRGAHVDADPDSGGEA